MGANSPYTTTDFIHVLMDAVEHTDFTNNTCIRVGGPTGETVFSRLNRADFEKIKGAFVIVMEKIFPMLKRLLRNRQVCLAFDITEESFYGRLAGLWIHPNKPDKGSTGCFKYLTVSCSDSINKLVLGSLPVPIGADIVALVTELLDQARGFVAVDVALFDRGFDNYQLVEALQKAKVHYQILWKKPEWVKKVLKTMKRGKIREVNRIGQYSRDKSKHKIKLRFVVIKSYKRFGKGKAYNWVFCTNTRQKSQHWYVDKYRKRWNIETAFRVLDNIQIKTTTKNEVIRYFINMFCCLIYNLWKMSNVLEYRMTLKNFVAKFVEYVRGIANTLFTEPDG